MQIYKKEISWKYNTKLLKFKVYCRVQSIFNVDKKKISNWESIYEKLTSMLQKNEEMGSLRGEDHGGWAEND